MLNKEAFGKNTVCSVISWILLYYSVAISLIICMINSRTRRIKSNWWWDPNVIDVFLTTFPPNIRVGTRRCFDVIWRRSTLKRRLFPTLLCRVELPILLYHLSTDFRHYIITRIIVSILFLILFICILILSFLNSF